MPTAGARRTCRQSLAVSATDVGPSARTASTRHVAGTWTDPRWEQVVMPVRRATRSRSRTTDCAYAIDVWVVGTQTAQARPRHRPHRAWDGKPGRRRQPIRPGLAHAGRRAARERLARSGDGSHASSARPRRYGTSGARAEPESTTRVPTYVRAERRAVSARRVGRRRHLPRRASRLASLCSERAALDRSPSANPGASAASSTP